MCGNPLLFPIVLLDLMTLSPRLNNVARAITEPYVDLLLTFLLLLIFVLIFASLGFTNLEEDMIVDGDVTGTSVPTCQTMLQCFLFVFTEGWRSSDVATAMDPVNFSEDGHSK